MAYVLDARDATVVKVLQPPELVRYRILLDDAESEELRKRPGAVLARLGIDLPDEYGNGLTIIELESRVGPIQAAGDCYRVKCYDLYCCPPYAICFECIVCEEASLLAQFEVALKF